jgi:hypothetical protein
VPDISHNISSEGKSSFSGDSSADTVKVVNPEDASSPTSAPEPQKGHRYYVWASIIFALVALGFMAGWLWLNRASKNG